MTVIAFVPLSVRTWSEFVSSLTTILPLLVWLLICIKYFFRNNYLAYLERNNKTRQAVAFLKKLDKENNSWDEWLSPRINRLSP